MATDTAEKTQKGTINVSTENIFPIIKKFLYSDHEIFLRELVANATDATQKLKTLSGIDKFKGDLGELTIEVELDEKAGTLTIKDKGIGMSADEVNKYINDIAFSGAEEFVNKYKDKAEAIIGHFGLGFYSSFMVAKKVEIITKSYVKSKKAAHWTCDGSPNYTLTEHDRKERGTDIILHIADDSKEFLEKVRIQGILDKYCKFLPVAIKFGTKTRTEYAKRDDKGEKIGEDVQITEDNIINNTNPAWTKQPADLKEEDYKTFYRELYPGTFEEPLFNIHLNVDYPFNLTGILYFPKIKQNIQVQKDKIQLYSNQVFITDNVENIVPEFLTLLHGVIDSPDIPLNVSRSYLQSDHNVKKISNHISKKVSDKLHELFKADREDFEKKWDDIKIFIQYGMLSDDKFYDRATKFWLFKNTDGKYFTFEEYKEHITAAQTDKDSKLVYLYTNDTEAQHSYIDIATEKGYDVLVMDSPLDSHFVNQLEQKLENSTFARVDADIIDRLINKDEQAPGKLSDEEKEKLKPIFEKQVNPEEGMGKFTVQFENLSEKDMPVVITQPEFMRRMNDMQKLSGQGGMMGMGGFEMYNLVVNANHPKVGEILRSKGENKEKKAKQLCDLALLSQGLLKGKDLSEFLKRSVEMI
ncbi:MAG: molecular chaperone HtpG [Flavobacteriales bacterium]|nr:molecular chaperone HtpG [Flavobacteriales bacterium]